MWVKPSGHKFPCPAAEIVTVLRRHAVDLEVGKAILPTEPTVRPITAENMLWMMAHTAGATVVCREGDAPCYIIDMQDGEWPGDCGHRWLAIFEYSPLFAVIRQHHEAAERAHQA